MKFIQLFKAIVLTALALCWLPLKADVITFPGSVTFTNGYLSAALNNITSNTRTYFEYGVDSNYGSFTSSQYFNPPGSQIVDAVVRGLPPGTYHYRIVAFDAKGASTGADMTFTISGPIVTTLPASVISSNNVILNGFVNPNGVATTAYFQYGQTTNYGSQTIVTNVGAGSMLYLVAQSLSGLLVNPATHYRIVASNSLGVSVGSDLTFGSQIPLLTAYPQSFSTNAGKTNVIQLAGSGPAPLRYSIVKYPRFGTIVTNLPGGIYTTNTGQCQYRPYAFATFRGQDSFTFKVSNGANSSAEATVSITVLPVNNAPHAQDQVVKVLKNSAYFGSMTGDDDADAFDPYSDLTNYSDPNGKGYHYSPSTPNLTYTILSNPTNGTLITNFSSFTYTPNTNFVGKDGFTFKVNDGALDSTNIGIVSFVVATNVGAIRPGFDKYAFGRGDDQGYLVSLTGTNADWLGRDLLLQFSKFSTNYFTKVFANNNGNLTFNSANAQFAGEAFPSTWAPMIAPFWADVLTTDSRSGVMTYGMQYVAGRLAVGVTWTNVMTTGNTTNTNSFQVLLIDRSDVQVGNFDIEYNYDKIQWLNGSFSTALPSVGFNMDNGLYYNLPNSRTTFLADSSTNGLIYNSNVLPPVPGRYLFRMHQPRALSQSIVALANRTNAITLTTDTAILNGPTNGTLSGIGGLNPSYRPNTNYTGPDSFTFAVSDGSRSSTNTVSISVVGLPTITNTVATVATNGSVLLNSTINPGYGNTTFYIKYGITTNYGSLATLGGFGFGSGIQAVISSLETNQSAALSFNGFNQYVKVPATISNDFTIEFWMLYPRLTSFSEGQWYQGLGLVDGSVSDGTNDFGVSIGNGKIQFGVGGPDTTITSGQLLEGSWHHIAATRVRTNGAMALYIDGVLAASTNGSTATLNAATNLTIGCLRSLTNFFSGRIDEVRLWNVARTPGEIQLTMNRSLSGTNSGLLACYHLDEWPTTNAVDASGNGKTGTIVNNPEWADGNAPVGFLIPGTLYHYQIVAVNGAGTNSTADLTFLVPGTNASLSTLTVSNSPISPAFAPGISNYVSTVANSVSNITVSALSADTNATIQIQINGGAFSAPVLGGITNQVMLDFGSNMIRFKVTSHDEQNTKTYTLIGMRLLSDDATLSSVTADGASLTQFGATYSGQVPNTVSNISITAIANNPYATLLLNGSSLASGVASGTIPLSFGINTFNLLVTSQSGFSSIFYTVQVIRPLNTNANLASLTCSTGLLNPAFSSNVTSYSLTVPFSVGSLTVTPTCVDSVYATVAVGVNGGIYAPVTSGSASGALGLHIGPNTISVVVTAQNGTLKTNTLAVTRLAAMPVATTQPASAIAVSSALLNAGVIPNGDLTLWSFQYGPDTNYTKVTPSTYIVGGTNLISVSNLLTGLLPGTTNYFRVVASNSFGVAMGADMSFVNLADAPGVTNVAADNIAHSTVSLHGSVNPNGAVTIACFQYGQSTNYGSSTILTNLGGGTTSLLLNVGLSNLVVGTTYHYQLVATNSAGVSSSGDRTFTLFASPETTGVSQQADGSFQLQFNGGAGLSYTLQTSIDLTNWLNFTNLVAGPNGLFIFNDATATNSPIRFYRLTQP